MPRFLERPPIFLFFTGKGGVGKTSLACASAVFLADAGQRVLLVSTDPASNVGQVFGLEIGNHITAIPAVPRLAALPPVLEPTARAEAVAEAVLAEQPVEDFSVRCLGSSDPAYLAYAIATIETAFAASKAPNEKELVLSFSLGHDVDLFAWLALITRIAPRAPTSFVWTEDVPTLLVTFGAPSTGLLGFIERTDSRSPNLWPVSTTNEQARADALSSLPVVSRQSLTHGASLGDFLSRIGRSA